MTPKYKKIVKQFNGDIKTIVTVVVLMPFIIDPLIGILHSFDYMLKWWWIVPLISLVFLVGFVTSEPFKLWMLSQDDMKENRIIKKEIIIEELKDNYSLGGHHHGGIIEHILFDFVYRIFDRNLKTIGCDKKYTLTDTENNTYHLMNYYKTKIRKKDLKNNLVYSSLKGRVIEIEYLEQSKVILSIKMDKATKNSKLIGGFWEIFGGYMM